MTVRIGPYKQTGNKHPTLPEFTLHIVRKDLSEPFKCVLMSTTGHSLPKHTSVS